MDERRFEPHPRASDEQPVLTRLEQPPRSGIGHWRLAAAALSLVLLSVIAAGRLGMQEPRPAEPSRSAAPTPPRAALTTPVPDASPAPDEPIAPPSISEEVVGPRYPDGIPTSIRGVKVYRLADALRRGDATHAVLVGGWYQGPDCSRLTLCPFGRMTGSPSSTGRVGGVTVTGKLDLGAGPRVFRALVHACRPDSECRPKLQVSRVVWAGDYYTDATPLEAQAVVGALAYGFPEMQPEPFRDLARCPILWPPQTYRSTTGGPRMTMVFPSVEDRLAAEPGIVANWPQPADSTTGQCTDHFIPADEATGWIAQDNVMLWLGGGDQMRTLAQAALSDAAGQSEPAEMLQASPLTTWRALSALRLWDSSLDFLPAHDLWVEIWSRAPDGSQHDVYALNDPFVQVLFVFPSRAERRDFQATVGAEDVAVIGCCLLRSTLAPRLLGPDRASVRWLGFRNVLIQLSGPSEFDEQLRDVLDKSLS